MTSHSKISAIRHEKADGRYITHLKQEKRLSKRKMTSKPKYIDICKTDIKQIAFELEKAKAVYDAMEGLRASNRSYQIGRLLNKLRSKLSQEDK